MPASVQWVNQPEWNRAFLAVIQQWEDQAPENLEKLGQLAEQEAKTRAPVKTGRLRRGIEHDVAKDTMVLTNEVPYAGYVEFGTRHSRAQPHMRPGFAAAVNRYEQIMKQGME